MRSSLLFALSLVTVTTASTSAIAKRPGRTGVFVNRVELDRATLQHLRKQLQINMTPGRHWYDRMTGAWGFVGGPTAGFIVPNLNLGGKLWRGASHGNTGVIVNGRELHAWDVTALSGYGIPVMRGRYWLNAFGVGGYEGGPPLFNLAQLAQRSNRSRGSNRSRRGRTSGRRKSALSTWDLTGVKVY